jgi:hypothetical protein
LGGPEPVAAHPAVKSARSRTFWGSVASASVPDDLVDLVADLLVAANGRHVLEGSTRRDFD